MTETLKALELRRATENLASVFSDIVREVLTDRTRRPAERVQRVIAATKELEQLIKENLGAAGPGRPPKVTPPEADPFVMPYLELLHRRASTRQATKAARALAQQLDASPDPAAPYVKQLIEGG